MDSILANVLNSWRLSDTGDLAPEATDLEVREAEKKLCRAHLTADEVRKFASATVRV